MAKKTIRIRAKAKSGVTTVKAIISHPMETGLRKDKKKGGKVPAHFIQEVVATHNGAAVMTAHWGPAVSKNPYVSFEINGGKKGDAITVSWVDNKGGKDTAEAAVK